MRCPICAAASRVLETRATDTHATRRVRECDNLHRFETFEVVGPAVHRDTLTRAESFILKQQARWARDRDIRLSEDEPAVIAAKYGLSVTRVNGIRNGRRSAGPYAKR